jgi:rhodanese-related sulfurtransferase
MSAQTHRNYLLALFGQTSDVLEDFVSSRTGEEQEERSVPEQYSARDLLTVIAFWMDYTVERMGYYQRGEAPPHEVDFDAVQAQALQLSAGHLWSAAVASVRRALAALTALVERSSEALLETYNYYHNGEGGPLWGEVRANGFLVPLEECEQYLRQLGEAARADRIRERLTSVVGVPVPIVCALVSPQELRVWQQQAARDPLVIDVRSAADYAKGHVPGARRFPLAQLAQQTARLPTDRPIVTYCNMHHPGQSRGERAASLLSAAGFEAMALAGGYPAWEVSGLPVEAARQEEA